MALIQHVVLAFCWCLKAFYDDHIQTILAVSVNLFQDKFPFDPPFVRVVYPVLTAG